MNNKEIEEISETLNNVKDYKLNTLTKNISEDREYKGNYVMATEQTLLHKKLVVGLLKDESKEFVGKLKDFLNKYLIILKEQSLMDKYEWIVSTLEWIIENPYYADKMIDRDECYTFLKDENRSYFFEHLKKFSKMGLQIEERKDFKVSKIYKLIFTYNGKPEIFEMNMMNGELCYKKGDKL
jgi:hypothetical protein